MSDKQRNIWWIGMLLLAAFLSSCSLRAIREAKSVVAQADSLWHAGMPCGDSIAPAQAFTTLDTYQFLYPDDYAHACYHYGRLLREKENPVEAMQCFIHATHSHTRDYHILGRVYSNMGEIAHLTEEYSLSYDMFERSGEMFLQIGDTVAYYYALNDMAFEQAYQTDSSSCISLLKRFEYIPEYMTSSTMTKAELYLKCHEYDSAIYYAHQLCMLDENNVIGLLIKAQSFSYLHMQDSAAYYAKAVLNQPSYSLSDKQNALYILTNDDIAKNIEEVRKAAADRSDVQQVLKIRQGKMSQAVQLLEQDLHRKPDYRWLYAIIATLIIVGISISIYVSNKRKKHGLLSQKVDDLQHAASAIQEKHDDLNTRYLTNHKHIEEEINKKCSMLCSNEKIKNALVWKNYNKMCALVDKQFYLLATKLRSKQCLNETEIRLCILTLLNCGYDQMAELLYHSNTSIGTLKLRVAKKLGTTSKQLRQYLIDNECIR